MHQEINQIRISTMSQMLLEMARGNFSTRIPRSDQNDELEGLVVLMNMAAEEMKESVFHSGFVNPHTNYKYIVQSTFILDEDFTIKTYNTDASLLLGFTADFFLEKNFNSLLTEASQLIWKTVEQEILTVPNYHTTLELVYVSHTKLLAPAFCTIYRFDHCSKILISSITSVVEENSLLSVSPALTTRRF